MEMLKSTGAVGALESEKDGMIDILEWQTQDQFQANTGRNCKLQQLCAW